jgi:2-desacetyl-2-hydroxyethyl bacteriochlorophyllide A dehydrogenase
MTVLNKEQQYLLFTAPEEVDIRTRRLPDPGRDEVLVKTRLSAISSGTETLIYKGLFQEDEERDSSIPALKGSFQYPFQYGYSSVGTVTDVGDPKNQLWSGKRVFAFQPHANSFLSKPEDLIFIPDELSDEEAVFLPNMETAVNLVMDGLPLIGERVAVVGLGIIGLLTTSVLSQFPLDLLAGIDLYPSRRTIAGKMSNTISVTPEEAVSSRPEKGYDLIYELSGTPKGLNLALELAGYESRIVIGSWYGRKGEEINLGGKFHRSRIKMISSQVSTIASGLTGRWTKQRRFSVAFQQLKRIQPSQWITHKYSLDQAKEAYRQLVSHPEDTLQVIFTYTTN